MRGSLCQLFTADSGWSVPLFQKMYRWLPVASVRHRGVCGGAKMVAVSGGRGFEAGAL